MRNGSKYNAVPTRYLGRRYDSKSEAARAEYLHQMLQGGALKAVVPQPGTVLLGDDYFKYRPDFFIVDEHGDCWYEDVKGVETARFKLTKKAWSKYGPGDLRVVRASGKKWTATTIKGGGSHLDTMSRSDDG
ncbi:MAG: DUF1064 domain-containing protein [Planctomycetota bacterium]